MSIGYKDGVRTELDSALDLDTMSLHEVVAYAVNHPGTHHELAGFIRGKYDTARTGALIETAALHGALDEPLFRILQSESI